MVMMVLSPAEPTSVLVPSPDQVIACPSEVNAVAGAVNVNESGSLSTSEAKMVPVATAALVVSRSPAVSGMPAARPSSDTCAAELCTTGASLVPKIVISRVVDWGGLVPSVTAYVKVSVSVSPSSNALTAALSEFSV